MATAQQMWRRRVLRGAPAALLALVVGCNSPGGGNGPTNGPTTDPTPDPTPSPTDTGDGTEQVTAYYVVDTRAGLRLAREHRDVMGDDGAQQAVEYMISGPLDPDYSTTWNPDTDVLGVTQDGDTITVDLSEEARTANVGSEGAALMIQQLVYTVTGDDPDALVELLIEGEVAGELWGAVVWDEPVGRDDPLDVHVFTQIDTPTEGATVTSPVTVAGEAAAFEANVPWRVLDTGGNEVEVGFTMTTSGQEFAPFSFEVELDPGTYVIEISESDPSGGEAGEPMTDTKTVTVS